MSFLYQRALIMYHLNGRKSMEKLIKDQTANQIKSHQFKDPSSKRSYMIKITKITHLTICIHPKTVKIIKSIQ